jgi:LAO/AO transport system kinase
MIKGRIPLVEHSVVNGLISPSQAVTELIRCFDMDRAAIKHLQSDKL